MTDEEQLRLAISLSLNGLSPLDAPSSSTASSSSTPAIHPPKALSQQEQLAEIRKQRALHYAKYQVEQAVTASSQVDRSLEARKQQGHGQDKKRAYKSESEDEDIVFTGMTKRPKDLVDETQPHTQTSRPSTSTSSRIPPLTSFPTPSIRLTQTLGRQTPPLSRNTVRFSDITCKDHLQGGFIFAFFIAQDELFQHLPVGEWAGGRKVPIHIGRDLSMDPLSHLTSQHLGIPLDSSNRPPSPESFEQISRACAQGYEKIYGENFRACYVNKTRAGCGHSKVGCLVFDGFLRVFITSANLMNLDFENGDNHWFIVDLPLLPKKRSKSSPTPEFEQELLEHVQALGCPKEFINSIYARYDYSSVEGKVRIVQSVPSSSYYRDEDKDRYGSMRLREIVRPLLKRAGVEEVQVELCTGSIGGMQADWLRAMLHCFSGARYDALSSVGYPEDFRITYPTRPDVEATRERSQAGASQIGSHFNWNDAPRTVKDMFRHYRSKDQAPGERGERGNGCLFHQKLYMCFPKGTTDLKTPPIYLYIGSANFSKAAWGKAVPEIKKKQVGKEMERLADLCNFELGVVVRGEDLPSMLEQGSEWEDVVPHRRDTENFTGRDKPFNSESWVKK